MRPLPLWMKLTWKLVALNNSIQRMCSESGQSLAAREAFLHSPSCHITIHTASQSNTTCVSLQALFLLQIELSSPRDAGNRSPFFNQKPPLSLSHGTSTGPLTAWTLRRRKPTESGAVQHRTHSFCTRNSRTSPHGSHILPWMLKTGRSPHSRGGNTRGRVWVLRKISLLQLEIYW